MNLNTNVQIPFGWVLWWDNHKEELKPTAPFSNFEGFCKFDHLPAEYKAVLMTFLKDLYSESGADWQPGNCRQTPTIVCIAMALLNSGDYPIIIGIEIKTYIWEHFWIELQIERFDEPVIIDPTGVPIDPKCPTENIQPFFGTTDLAHGFASRIYSSGKDYEGDTRAYRFII